MIGFRGGINWNKVIMILLRCFGKGSEFKNLKKDGQDTQQF